MNPNTNQSFNPDTKSKLPWILGGIGLIVLAVGGVLLSNNLRPKSTSPISEQVTVPAQVSITKSGFVPANLSIKPGTKVTWTNDDSEPHRIASNPHPSHTGLAGLDSKEPPLGPKASYSYTFETAGTFTYHDHYHPALNGAVKVSEE